MSFVAVLGICFFLFVFAYVYVYVYFFFAYVYVLPYVFVFSYVYVYIGFMRSGDLEHDLMSNCSLPFFC